MPDRGNNLLATKLILVLFGFWSVAVIVGIIIISANLLLLSRLDWTSRALQTLDRLIWLPLR